MFCYKCGENIPDNEQVCPKCGASTQNNINDNQELVVTASVDSRQSDNHQSGCCTLNYCINILYLSWV